MLEVIGRVAVLAFVVVELVIPTWVFYDLRRRPDAESTLWVHAAAMPVLNVLGLFGYLEARRRETSNDRDNHRYRPDR